MYLGLGVDATRFKRNIQCILLKNKDKSTKVHTYGAITLYGATIPSQLQLNKRGLKTKSTHHISQVSQQGIQFDLHRFRSPLLTISQLLSLPPPTKMFQFSGFPILTDQHKKMLGSPIRQSRDQKMSAPTPSLSQLTTTFIGNSSLAIPQIVQVAIFSHNKNTQTNFYNPVKI